MKVTNGVHHSQHNKTTKRLKVNEGHKAFTTVNTIRKHIWYTNVDTLTKDKLLELNAKIKSPPDIIAMTEIKPKNYTRVLEHKQYNLGGRNKSNGQRAKQRSNTICMQWFELPDSESIEYCW